jgi:hypothetical protein
MSLTTPGATATNWNNASNAFLPTPPFSVRPSLPPIDPATERLLTQQGILSPPSGLQRQARGAGSYYGHGHQKYPQATLPPRITEPSRLSEISTADLGQRSAMEQAAAIRDFQALNGPQILGLRRANLADVYFLHALQNNGLGPFTGRQAFDNRVQAAYAASTLWSEGPSVSAMLSQLHDLHGAIQASVADYQRAYPDAPEAFLGHAIWQMWRPAWQGIAAGTQGHQGTVTAPQLHEAVQSAQQARQILDNYASFGPRQLAGIGDVSNFDHGRCVSSGVLNWQSQQTMQVNAPRGTRYDVTYRPWYWPFVSWPAPRVNYQNNTARLHSHVIEQRLSDRPVFVTQTGYTDDRGNVLGTWSPVNSVVATAQVTGSNALIDYERAKRRQYQKPC